MRIAIVGGGTAGSMIAWRLARRGYRPVVFEKYAGGHDRSAGGGESRIFRVAYREGADYIPLLQSARRLWQELELESEREIFRRLGYLSIHERGSDALQSLLSDSKEYDLKTSFMDSSTINAEFPQHHVSSQHEGLFDHSGGYLRPELAIISASEVARGLGAEIRNYDSVLDIHERSSGICVESDSGKQEFDSVVVCAGPWLGRLLPSVAAHVKVRRRITAWFVPRKDSQGLVSGLVPFSRDVGTDSFYGLPGADNSSVKIGVTSEEGLEVSDPDALCRSVSVGALARYRELVGQALPWLIPEPIRVSAYQEAYSRDSKALVGRVPGSRHLLVAGAFSGHGFKMAPAIGEIISSIILSGSEGESRFLSPDRLVGVEG